MEATGLAFSAAQTLLAALGCAELKRIFSRWGYRSELESLERTVSSVKAVLLDAQSLDGDTQKLSHFARDSIDKLKDVVYDAEDLIDEFATLAKQHKISDGTSLRKVRRLFSRLQNLKLVYKMSKEVKIIRKKLDQTTDEAAKFGFKVDIHHVPNRVFSRDETHAYANENCIVGRDEDKRRIIDILLDTNIQEDVSILAIVGVGGLGKTTLAQLVYNDQSIQTEFGSQRFWVCVSDQDQNESDKAKMILAKILQSTNGVERTDKPTYDSIVQQLRSKLGQDKYLLVLDDMWTEDTFESQTWLEILMGSAQKGSRIVATTRSKRTATALGSNCLYELKGLSNENSWGLFEMVVGKEKANRHDLLQMGKDIVKKCSNVPLAIKVLGSLLRDQDKNKWRSFHQSKLNEIREGENGNKIMKILKFSYYHLPPALKACFAYCAMFPKDFRIQKEKLLRLWISNGYVELLDGGQVIEEAAEEYFQMLVQRCFFQDVEKSYLDGKFSFKIHDLMHDIAQEVAGNEIFIEGHKSFVGGCDLNSLNKKVRHLFDDDPCSRNNGSFATRTTIRSYVLMRWFPNWNSRFPVSSILANWRHLRALDLGYSGLRNLPDAIGELLHLRYIDLSGNAFLKMLPESVTKLINLQALLVYECFSLKELPIEFNKLVNLRTLEVCEIEEFRKGLSYMPLGMEKLTSLCWLNGFVVANRESNLKHDLGGLRDLKGLMNLRGSLTIWISEGYRHAKDDDGKGYLSNKQYLKDIRIQFGLAVGEETMSEDDKETSEGNMDSGEHLPSYMCSDEALLEDLQPHCNLEVLMVEGYSGVKIPSWARKDNLSMFLPNLVKIVFEGIYGWQELPYLSKLPSLRKLQVSELPNLMYMENRTTEDYCSSSYEVSSPLFFPSLEELYLWQLPQLEGWWNEPSMLVSGSESGMGSDEIVNSKNNARTDGDSRVPSFPRLSRLYIEECPRLTSIPLCPTVEKLELLQCNDKLQIMIEEENHLKLGGSDDSGNSTHGPKLRYIETDNMRHLGSLPGRALQNLEEIDVKGDTIVESLSEVGEALHSCSSSLRTLRINGCYNLRSVSGGLEYLTALESLVLSNLPKLSFEEVEVDDMPWRCLRHCLRSLEVNNVPQVVDISKGMTCLTSLKSLRIQPYNPEVFPVFEGWPPKLRW